MQAVKRLIRQIQIPHKNHNGRLYMRRYIVPFMRPFWVVAVFMLVLHALPAMAQNNGILNNVSGQFQAQAASWSGTLMGYATWLFWTLGTISLVWTGGTLILRKADIGDFFAEFIRFILFFGFFLWLLRNAPAIGSAIMNSFMTMGANASQTGASNPSAVLNIGFQIFHKVMEQTTIWSPVDSMIGAVLAGIILICVALIAANMTILLCAAWVLLYGGIFFLGFGGSRWTSEIAIHYYKSIIGIGASLMAMILMIGIAQNIINDYYNQMSVGIQINQIATIMVVAIILLQLVHRVPGLITGLINGASIGHSGIATFGHNSFMNAVGAGATAGMVAGAMVAEGVKHAAGSGQALGAAVKSAQQNMADNKNANANSASSPVSSLASAMSTGASFVAHVGKSLASGIGKELKKSADTFNDTFPGRVAGHIHSEMAENASKTAASDAKGNSENSGDAIINEQDEIKAFVDK